MASPPDRQASSEPALPLEVATVQLDLHQLELRFEATRVADQAAVKRLADSMQDCGQMVACIAAGPVADARWVLMDGYRRVAALRRLGRDTAQVQCWACPLEQALAQILARSRSRSFAAIEEALLLRELIDAHGLSQRQAARLCARDVSWVQRRLVLLGALSQELVQAVRSARISSWAASRIVAPLARANSEHARALLSSLDTHPLSTRELSTWFQHYQGAQRSQRARMVEHPRLLIESLKERQSVRSAKALREGPERELSYELGHLQSLLERVRRRLAQAELPAAAALVFACRRVHAAWPEVAHELRRLCHDADTDSQQHLHSGAAGNEPARDQPSSASVA